MPTAWGTPTAANAAPNPVSCMSREPGLSTSHTAAMPTMAPTTNTGATAPAPGHSVHCPQKATPEVRTPSHTRLQAQRSTRATGSLVVGSGGGGAGGVDGAGVRGASWVDAVTGTRPTWPLR